MIKIANILNKFFNSKKTVYPLRPYSAKKLNFFLYHTYVSLIFYTFRGYFPTYMDLILGGVKLGVFMSVFLVGPVYFILIETSISKGIRAALSFDIGVLLSDIVLILFAYFASQEILSYLKVYPQIKLLGTIIIIAFGLFMILRKSKINNVDKNSITKNVFSNFIHGFVLNIFNIGVLLFWIAVIWSLSAITKSPQKTLSFFTIALGTFFFIDILKILLAKKVKHFLSPKRISAVRKIAGILLITIAVVILIKGQTNPSTSPEEDIPNINIQSD